MHLAINWSVFGRYPQDRVLGLACLDRLKLDCIIQHWVCRSLPSKNYHSEWIVFFTSSLCTQTLKFNPWCKGDDKIKIVAENYPVAVIGWRECHVIVIFWSNYVNYESTENMHWKNLDIDPLSLKQVAVHMMLLVITAQVNPNTTKSQKVSKTRSTLCNRKNLLVKTTTMAWSYWLLPGTW